MNGVNLRHFYETNGPVGFYNKVTHLLRKGEVKANQVDLKEMFLAVCGERAYSILGEKYARRRGDVAGYELCFANDDSTGAEYSRLEESQGWSDNPGHVLREDGEVVDVSAFSAIVGQIAFTLIGDGWRNAEMVGDRIFRNIPTEFSGQKIPWLSNLFGPNVGDDDIHAGMDYPEATFGPRYVTSPRVTKKGGILSIPLEFLLFDRTGQAGKMGLMKLGEATRYRKEYQQLKVFLGFNPVGPMTAVASSPWGYNLNGTFYQTYLTSGSNYVNAQSGTPFIDFTSINNSLYLRSKILDPDSGRPITLGPPKDMFVMPQQMMVAKRVLASTGTTTFYPSPGTTGVAAPGTVKVEGGNPIDWQINLMTSPIAYQLMLGAGQNPAGVAGAPTATQINAYWWSGNFQETFYYAEIFPLRSEQAIAGNIRDFQADTKLRFKCSEMGVPFVYDPRQTNFFYNS